MHHLDSVPNDQLTLPAGEAEWSVELGPNEIQALSDGVSPLLIRPEHLCRYAPMQGSVADV